MMTIATHSWFMTVRHLRRLSRQPFAMAMSLIQPIVWMLLFTALFSKVVEIPGFAASSYLNFVSPGIVVMAALFASGFAGMMMIGDYDRGVLDRFPATPAHRGSLIAGALMQQAVKTLIQSLIMILLALIIGARFPGGALGVLVLIASSVVLGVAIGALSTGMAVLVPRQEALISSVQFVILPLTFLAGVLMPRELAPVWIQAVARFNPVNWAVQAGREALKVNVDWRIVLSNGGYLLAFAIICTWLATRAFRTYQRSV